MHKPTSIRTKLAPLLADELMRYGMASAINTATGIGLIALLYWLTGSATASLTTSTVLGYVYSLATYNSIAFHGNRKQPPFVRYGIIYSFALLLNLALTRILVARTGSFLVAQIVVLPPLLVLQWLAAKHWAFRQEKNQSNNGTC